ncbi:MAG: helix-turn-helix transcriptional regulator [Thermoleophilia bacterium]
MGRSGGSVRAPESGGAAGERVRDRRRAAGLTQQQLAEAVGVSRQTIISMETGDYAPSVYLALSVAAELDITVEGLWGSAPAP